MVMSRFTVLCACSVLGVMGVLSPSAAEVITVWTHDGGQNGWTKAISGSTATKADFSVYAQPCKGSPGPSPVGSFYMQTPQSSSNIGQAWFGTDYYSGIQLSDITALKYWTILDYRGIETAPTLTDYLDEFGNRIPMSSTEWTPSSFPTQPIQLYLFVRLSNDSPRTLIYRPWSAAGTPGFGPSDGSLCRRWQEWDCLNSGYWMQEEGPLQVNTWAEILAKPEFEGAYLSSPTFSAQPAWGAHECPVPNGDVPAKGSSLCFELGARALTNNDFPEGYRAWWRESYSAYGAVDKLTISGVDFASVEFTHEYDFQAPGITLRDPVYNKIRALNNSAVFDQAPWVPEARYRGPNPPVTWGGYLTQNYFYKMNALQRAANFNYDSPIVGRNPDQSPIYGYTYGHLFTLYGRVSDVTGDFFKVDDGSGRFVDCYCPNAQSKPIVEGQFVRMVGTPYGQSPTEWYFNMFHVVKWNADPEQYEYSRMFPWRFDTYTWNVDVLDQ